MARVVVFGLGPMRWESSRRLFALPLRTWHFAGTLARDGHDVLLFAMRTAAFEGWPADRATAIEKDGVRIISLSEQLLAEHPSWVDAQIRAFGPGCVVGVNPDGAAAAARHAGELPFWADVNGDPMAEAQAKAEAIGTDAWTGEFHRRLVAVLARADVLSACSEPQRAALIGQLGMVGRLTGRNAGAELVHAIGNSVDDEELRALGAIERRPRAPHAPFVLLWSGGFNTWCDPDLLFEAVDAAMAEEPRLRFVSTGGGIEGHHTDAYDRFAARVARSRHVARYALAGWVETAELTGYYRRAHAAVLADRFGYEGVLGARTRMLDWVAAGLPVITTRLSEISRRLEAEGAALGSPCGDAAAMTENILALVRDPARAVAMGARGRRYAETHLRADRQLAPLREWVPRAARAPDRDRRLSLRADGLATTPAASLARQLVAVGREHGVRGALAGVARFATRRARAVGGDAVHLVELGSAEPNPDANAAVDEERASR